MKRILITIILLFTAMAIFSQDMSSYMNEYTRTDGTVAERLALLEAVRGAGHTGIGEFYHDALKYFFTRLPDIKTRTDEEMAEETAVILCQALGAEKYTAAAPEIWRIAELFDIDKNPIDPDTMQAALIALGDINAQDHVPHIVERLNNFNAQAITSSETIRRAQAGVIGCVKALEALHDIRGYKPIFSVLIDEAYDPPVREIAANSLPNIVENPSDVIIEIINDNINDPRVKLTAWNELLKSKVPDSSKAKVTAAAIAASWAYPTNNRSLQATSKEMRKSAINAVSQFGVADDSVYRYLERSYSSNFNTNAPDYTEIMVTLSTLTALKTDEAVELLHKFLIELNERRRGGPWGIKERQLFEWVVSCIGTTGTQSADIRSLLGTIQHTGTYTPHEQNMATNALKELGAQ